jgi:hypothetical protein
MPPRPHRPPRIPSVDYSDQVFYGFIRGSDGLVPVRPGFNGAPDDLRGGELLPAGDARNALPRFFVQSQCQRRCHGATFGLILPYYAVYYKSLRNRSARRQGAPGIAFPVGGWPRPHTRQRFVL